MDIRLDEMNELLDTLKPQLIDILGKDDLSTLVYGVQGIAKGIEITAPSFIRSMWLSCWAVVDNLFEEHDLCIRQSNIWDTSLHLDIRPRIDIPNLPFDRGDRLVWSGGDYIVSNYVGEVFPHIVLMMEEPGGDFGHFALSVNMTRRHLARGFVERVGVDSRLVRHNIDVRGNLRFAW